MTTEDSAQQTDQSTPQSLQRPQSALQLIALFDSTTNRISLGFAPRGSTSADDIVAKIQYHSFNEVLDDLFSVLRHVNSSHGNAGFAKGVAYAQAELNRQILIRQQAADQAKKSDGLEEDTAQSNQQQLQPQQNQGT